MSQNSNYLSDWIGGLQISELHKNHCDFIGIIGLAFFSIYKLRLDLFRKSLGLFYRITKNNNAFFRFSQNFIAVILKITEEKIPLQKRQLLYQDIWPVFLGIVGAGLKHYYLQSYDNEEIPDVKAMKKIEDLYIKRMELLPRYFTKEVLGAKPIPECWIFDKKPTQSDILSETCQDLFVYLTGICSNERDKTTLFKWLKATGGLLAENKKFFAENIFAMKIELEIDIKPIKRLNRLRDDNLCVVVRLFNSLVIQFQTLDSTEVSSY